VPQREGQVCKQKYQDLDFCQILFGHKMLDGQPTAIKMWIFAWFSIKIDTKIGSWGWDPGPSGVGKKCLNPPLL